MIRPMAKALLVLLMATTVYANDDVQDVRLRVQNLTRPDGKQSATLTGMAAPQATAQPVVVTLQIGATTATLTGKIRRSGRLRAVGRRLALATPLASFTEIEVDVSGGLVTSFTMAAGDCVASPNGRRLDCVETSTPTPTPTPTSPGELTDGAYDLTITGHTPVGTTESGSLTTNPDGTRTLRLWDSALDFATLTMATDGTLSGYYVMGGDAFVTVAGSATDQSTAALARLSGSFSGFIGTYSFTMERVSEGTDGALGGTWNLTFVGGGLQPFSGTAVLDLTVPATGLATAAPTTLVRNGGMTAYTTGAGTCTVAPAGGVYCMLPRAVGAGAVYLHGMLDADGGSGQGTFAIGAAPAIDSTGTWSATR
jgi:hypothetical protein